MLCTGGGVQALLAKHSKSLFAVESKRPLRDFDTLGFSLAYELGATNVLQMLKMSVRGLRAIPQHPTFRPYLMGEDVRNAPPAGRGVLAGLRLT